MFDGTALCFDSLSCPPRLLGVLHKNKVAHLKYLPSSRVFASRPPLVVLQTERTVIGSGSGNQIPTQENTVGIIGVSALLTVSFLEELTKLSLNEGKELPPYVVWSDPVLNREIFCRERNFVPYTRARNTSKGLDVALVVKHLRSQRIFLEKSGVRCIVMPCHIANAWHDEISHGCSVPFLHIGECVAEELREAKLIPVETGSNPRIGILSPYPTLTTSFYREKLQSQEFEAVVLDEATMEHTVIPAMEALNRKDIEGARNLLRVAIQFLLLKAVNTIILASDDMHGLLPSNDPLLRKCLDPIDALARSTFKWACSRSS